MPLIFIKDLFMKKLLLLCLLSVACFAQLTLDFDKNKELCDKKNDAKACTLTGSLYMLKNKPDYDKAMEYAVKGCDGKDAGGCLSAGGAYFMGMGVKKDEAKAMQFYKKGCDLNDKLSCEMYKSNGKALHEIMNDK
jgi:TPR repeat protein